MVDRLRQPDQETIARHEQRHRLHPRQPRTLSRGTEGAAGDSEHQRAARACRRRAALRRVVRGRDAADRAAERAAVRDARQSHRVRRLARRGGAPTILFYGHYDVQPVDPLDLWQSPPFEATIRDGEIYARGAADDKGQVFMHLKAIEAHLKQNGRLPVNIKLILEGEEEVGSANLDDFVKANKERAEGRRRRHFGFRDVRARRAVDLLRLARAGLLPGRSARQQHRPAFGRVRGRARQPRLRARAAVVADEGSKRPHQDSGLLRRCAATAGRGTPGLGAAALQREAVPQGLRHSKGARRVGLSRRSNGRGHDRPSK